MGIVKECRHTSVSIQWPLLYANNDLIGKGTVLTISARECVVTGTMPVAEGMLLKVWISPAQRNDALYVKAASVVWARQNEFGLEMLQVDAQDQEWLTRFVEGGSPNGGVLSW